MPYIYTLRVGSHRRLTRSEVLILLNRTCDRLNDVDPTLRCDGEFLLRGAQKRVRKGYGTQQLFVDGPTPSIKFVIDVEASIPKKRRGA